MQTRPSESVQGRLFLQNADSSSYSLADALSAANVAAASLDGGARIVELNAVASSLFGLGSRDAEGQTVAGFLRSVSQGTHNTDCGEVYRIEGDGGALRYVRVVNVSADGGGLARFDDVTGEWAQVARLSREIEIRNELMRQAEISMWSYDPDTDRLELAEVIRSKPEHARTLARLEWGINNLHPDDRALEAEARERVCRTGVATTTTLRLNKPDGGMSVVRVHTVPGRKVGSGLYSVHSLCENITSLVDMRDESARNARRLEMALLGAKAGVFEVDLRTNGHWESPYLVELIGEAALERSREDPFLKYHDDDVERVRALAQAAMATGPGGDGGVSALECRIYRPGEEDFWVRLDSRVDYDETGKPIRVVGMLQDINESKRQSMALAEARRETESISERLQIALAAARAGVYEYNVLTESFWASPELHEMAPDAIRAVEEGVEFGLYHPDERRRMREGWENITPTDDIRETDVRLYREDGEDFWGRMCLKVDFDDSGAPLRAVGLVQDINRRKREETEIIRAKMEAEAAAVAKTSFLASMSHEIRTPLNGVLGMAQVLQLGNLQDEQRDYVATIADCGKTLMSLLNDVLDISKIAAGKLEINPVEGDLAAAVGRVQQLFAANAKEKGLRLDIAVQPDLPSLKYDPVRVRQCLTNLVSNAIKFTEEGGVDIVLGGDAIGDGRYMVRVAVRDTGIGIEPSIVERLFEPFTQADETTTRRFGGTGLGLSIARDLARLMGGDISVSSSPGKGSEFLLTFQCGIAKPETEDEEYALPAADVAPFKAAGMSRIRVLLVDDNFANRKVARIFLRAFGALVVEAGNGVEAMKEIRTKDFDLVLLDVHMPVMDGREVIREIRCSDQPWRDIPVIALTAHAMQGDEEKFLSLGMDGYIAKPIDQTEFNDTMIRVLAQRAHATAENERKRA